MQRKPTRLKDYEYNNNGSYFITISSQDKANLFGEITVGADSISAQMCLNYAGELLDKIYKETISQYQNIKSDIYVIMPNHFHCIITISKVDMESTPTISEIIQTFKRNSTIKYITGVKSGLLPPFNKRIWQRSFYDHIIRNEAEYLKIWEYIDTNPSKWANDVYFTL